jgi:hypothetical protein
LMAQGVCHVHLPAYLCESVLQPIRQLGLEMSFYPVRKSLLAEPDPKPGSAVVLIHYFGQINPASHELRRRAGGEFHLIEDASQALLTDWRSEATDHIYYLISPRKFGPAPLGGWCNIVSDAALSEATSAIANRSLAARLMKEAYVAEADAPIESRTEEFYLDAFEAVEEFLSKDLSDDNLPDWVVSLIAGIDWSGAATARLRNLNCLVQLLPDRVRSPIRSFAQGEVPLGFPILCENRDAVRRQLSDWRIFCPVHWPISSQVSSVQFPEAQSLSEQILTLPLDQRHGTEDMMRLAETISELI